MSKDGCIVDMVIDNGDYSNREVKNAVQSIIQEPSSTGQIQGAHRVHGHQTIKSNSDKNKNSNCIVVKIDEIMGEGKDQPAKSSPSNYRLSSRCSLCMRFYQSTELTNGHLVKGPYSKNPLSKVLVMAVQSTLKLPRMNWLICNSCVDTLREADENLHELSKIQRKLTIMKKGLISMINPDVTGKVGDFKRTTPLMIGKTDPEEYTTKGKKEKKSFLTSSMSRAEAGDKISCPLCKKDMTKKSLKKHIPHLHKKEVPIICKVCVKRFSNEAAFADHLLSNHLDGVDLEDFAYACDIEEGVTQRRKRKTKLACPDCGIVFNRHYLRRHINEVHNKNYVVKCKLCPETFGKYSHRILHMRRVHGYAKPKMKELVTCQYCKRSYRGNFLLNRHIRKVHLCEEKVVQCDLCERVFKSTHLMVVHRRVHTDERPFMCQICKKQFRHSYGCRKHLKRVHKLELKYRLNDPLTKDLIPMIRLPTASKQPLQQQPLPPVPPPPPPPPLPQPQIPMRQEYQPNNEHHMVMDIPVSQNTNNMASMAQVHGAVMHPCPPMYGYGMKHL